MHGFDSRGLAADRICGNGGGWKGACADHARSESHIEKSLQHVLVDSAPKKNDSHPLTRPADFFIVKNCVGGVVAGGAHHSAAGMRAGAAHI